MAKKNSKNNEEVVVLVSSTPEEQQLSFTDRVDFSNTIDALMEVLGEIKVAKDAALASLAEFQTAGKMAFEKIQSIQSTNFQSLAAEFGPQQSHRAFGSSGRTRTPASNIAIGASRFVTNSHEAGKTRDEARSAAMTRANELAQGYGLAEVPAETVALIDAKVASLYK